jgi:chromosome partitioning protein
MKGGVAKTTTSIYLSEVASREAPTLLVDGDPQGSCLTWAKESGQALGATVADGSDRTVGRSMDQLTTGYGHVIFDTPPGFAYRTIVKSIVSAADAVIIPLSPSGLEIDRLAPTLEIAASFNVPAIVLLVRCRQTKSFGETIEGLKGAGIPLFNTAIPLREEIAASFGAKPTAFHGYDLVWAELLEAFRG